MSLSVGQVAGRRTWSLAYVRREHFDEELAPSPGSGCRTAAAEPEAAPPASSGWEGDSEKKSRAVSMHCELGGEATSQRPTYLVLSHTAREGGCSHVGRVGAEVGMQH